MTKRNSEFIPLLESDHHNLKKNYDYLSSASTNISNYENNHPDQNESRNSIDYIKNDFDKCDFKNVSVSWSNINCYAPNNIKGWFNNKRDPNLFKQLLFNVNGVVQQGQLMAIMGASGAGKSTLLNILTCRNLGTLKVEGDVMVNGIKMNSNIKKISAYVQQLDIFYGKLKVKEHLIYNGILRMGSKTLKQDIINRINALIIDLELTACQNDYINSNSHNCQGLAGSEKKLLSIACELLCDPPIIFLDEPTTGLDSKMAEKVLKILQSLAHNNKCIICTIHQPSSLIYKMFNQTYLLAEGRLIFQGHQNEALRFFSDVGFPCLESFNPADHFIYTLAIRPGLENDCRAKVIYIARKFQDTSEYGILKKKIIFIKNELNDFNYRNIDIKMNSVPVFKASYWQEIKVQTWKQTLDITRDSKLFLSRIIQNLISTIILSLMILQQKYDQIGVNNINGGIFSVINNMCFIAVVQVSSFIKELQYHNIEHQNGMCRSGSFLIAKSISDLPLFFITVTCTSIISYWIIGLYPSFQEFIIFYVVLLFVYQFSFSLNVLMIGSFVNNIGVAITVTALTVNVMMLMSGFLINDSTIPVYFKWLKYISCQRFGFEVLIINQWEKVDKIDCRSNFKDSCYNSGLDVINFLSFIPSNIFFDLVLLIGMTLLFKLTSLFIIIITAKERKLN